MKLHYIPLIILSAMFLTGCGSKGGPDLTPEASRKTIKSAPDWFLTPPLKEGFITNSSSATSQDMQMALDKARTSAASTLAGLIESEWNGLVKRAQEETGLAENSQIIDHFSNTQEQVISNRLKDIRVSQREIMEEKTDDGTRIYRAYVLVEFDEGAAQKRLLAQIKADEQLYTAMRATELYDEMEQKVEAYRQRHQE
ncbi:MAG: hypothetical protein QGF36_05110 [Candidatus Marinimicrobia bacterium]|jgi:hypothetical protein|nr:hypothetical protein [Candidatus Neomarinimicrobiota bacterium]MDP6936792.1 hypothetical protein [Candidatus Neomarinimicrobiota bacterium]